MNYNIKLCKSINKEIPDCIFTLPKNQLALFLKVLFTCDGTIYDYGVEYSSGSEKMIRQVQHLLLRFGVISKITMSTYNSKNYWNVVISDTYYIEKYIKQIGFVFSKQEKVFSILKKAKKMVQRCYLDGFPVTYRKIIIDKIKQSRKKHHCFKSITEVPNASWKITRNLLQKINKVLYDNDTNLLLNADIFFDEIKAITYVGKKETYDISVSKYHNFIANDIVAHNTWWLEDFGVRCLLRRLKVLFISLEMPKNQVIRRFHQSFLGEPRRKKKIIMPKYNDENVIEYIEVMKDGLSARRVMRRIGQLKTMTAGGSLRILCRPSRTLNVEAIKTEIYNMSYYEQFFPDVVIVDYADILSAEAGSSNEMRHRIDETWAKLRSLAQEINGLVVTATQSSRSTFTKDIDEEDTSEDIRKLAHVTHMIVLNQTREEKKELRMRIGVLASRENEFQVDDEAVVIYQYGIGKPIIDYRLKKDTYY